MTFARVLSIVQAVLFLIFGLWGYWDPVDLARVSEVALPSTAAVAEFRSFYAGSSMAFALMIGLAVWAGRVRDALWVQVVGYGCIVAGRLIHWASAGGLAPLTMKLLVVEAVSLAIAAWLLRRRAER